MPSSRQESVPLKNGNTLSGSFGTSSSGWCSQWLEVRYQDEINLGFKPNGGAANFTFRLETSSKARIDIDPDDAEIVQKVETDGDGVDDLVTKASGTTGSAFRVSTRGVEYLRIACLGSGDLDLSVSYDVPHSKADAAPLAVGV